MRGAGSSVGDARLGARAFPIAAQLIELLSEIVVDVLGPEGVLETGAQLPSVINFGARGVYLEGRPET